MIVLNTGGPQASQTWHGKGAFCWQEYRAGSSSSPTCAIASTTDSPGTLTRLYVLWHYRARSPGSQRTVRRYSRDATMVLADATSVAQVPITTTTRNAARHMVTSPYHQKHSVPSRRRRRHLVRSHEELHRCNATRCGFRATSVPLYRPPNANYRGPSTTSWGIDTR